MLLPLIPIIPVVGLFQIHLALLLDFAVSSFSSLLFFPSLLIAWWAFAMPLITLLYPPSPSRFYDVSLSGVLPSVLAGTFTLPFLLSYMVSSSPFFIPWIVLYLPLFILAGLVILSSFAPLLERLRNLPQNWREEFNLWALPRAPNNRTPIRLPFHPPSR